MRSGPTINSFRKEEYAQAKLKSRRERESIRGSLCRIAVSKGEGVGVFKRVRFLKKIKEVTRKARTHCPRPPSLLTILPMTDTSTRLTSTRLTSTPTSAVLALTSLNLGKAPEKNKK
jgi:hypothetical protein